MVKSMFHSLLGRFDQNKDHSPVVQQTTDNSPEERIDLTRNNRNTTDLQNLEGVKTAVFDTSLTNLANNTPNTTPQALQEQGSLLQTSPQRRDFSVLIRNEERFDDGYDTDGDIGPFFDAVQYEGEQQFDEEAVPEFGTTEETSNSDSDSSDSIGPAVLTAVTPAASKQTLRDIKNKLKNKKVVWLKTEL